MKNAIEPVPPVELESGFYNLYFIVPKKGGGLRPILDLRVLNRTLHKLSFKILTQRHIVRCIQPQDWLTYRCSFIPWTNLAFLLAGVPLDQVSQQVVVRTDASSMGWACNIQWASSLGALVRALTALAHQLPRAVGSGSSPLGEPVSSLYRPVMSFLPTPR